jgi:N-acetylneuraminic acid mutarotase
MSEKKIRFYKYGLLLTISFVAITCDNNDNDDDELFGNWIELSDFDGLPRGSAVAFSIGNKGYLGTGYDGSNRLNDFWEYDPARNAWTRKADFPGAARNSAVGFSISGKGYIGTGYDGENELKDFWEYNPSTDQWTQKADFGGTARYGAVGFSIGNKGYIGTGYDGNCVKDFWEYDPEKDQWTQKVSIGGGKRKDAIGFSINGIGYICTGIDNGVYEKDLWAYDPENDSWEKKNYIVNATDEDFDNDYTSLTGIRKVAFTINDKGYLATGGEGSVSTVVWEYDPVEDVWIEKTGLEGAARTDAAAFSIDTRGYITTGRSSSSYFDDIWGFDPDAEYNEYD